MAFLAIDLLKSSVDLFKRCLESFAGYNHSGTVPVEPTTNVPPSTILKTTRFPWHPNVSAGWAAFAKLTNLAEANRKNESTTGVKERSETSTSSWA